DVAEGVTLLGPDRVRSFGQVRGRFHRPGAVAGGGEQRLQRRAGGRGPVVELDGDRGRVAGRPAGRAGERRPRYKGRTAGGRAGQGDGGGGGVHREGGRGAEADVAGGVGLLSPGRVGAVGQTVRVHRPGVAADGGREGLHRRAGGGGAGVDLDR